MLEYWSAGVLGYKFGFYLFQKDNVIRFYLKLTQFSIIPSFQYSNTMNLVAYNQ